MKVVILAGGMGIRLSEETYRIPKPMVEIGGKPIIWHIMKYYSSFGFNDFIICCGYRGFSIKEYFCNYSLYNRDMAVSTKYRTIEYLDKIEENWNVELVDTGLETSTGGRIAQIEKYIYDDTNFMLTYGDGLCDVNLNDLVNIHMDSKAFVTLTAIQPKNKFGAIDIKENNMITSFQEKPESDFWVNGGFMVVNKEVFNILDAYDMFEKSTLPMIAKGQRLYAHKHKGFWKAMDTLKDKLDLEEMYNKGDVPWINW